MSTAAGEAALLVFRPADKGPISLVVDPSGQYVYVVNYGNNTISQYTIGSNSALTSIKHVHAYGSSWVKSLLNSYRRYLELNSGMVRRSYPGYNFSALSVF